MTYTHLIMFGFLLAISIYDCIYFKIPNTFLLLLLLVVFFSMITKGFSFVALRFLWGVLFSIVFFAIRQMTQGLGYGDIKLIFITCIYFGLKKSFYSLLFASVSGIFFCFIMYVLKKRMQKIPFSPFISSGYFLLELSESLI